MKPDVLLTHEFVEFIPDEVKERTLYISVTYCTAVHKCCCGCGREVVTPLSPTAWQLIFDGKTVSLEPSIGSWNLPCQSHYFITKNTVVWAPKWTNKRVSRGRIREANAREKYYAETQPDKGAIKAPSAPPIITNPDKRDAPRRQRKRKPPV
jgi:Family of unknown function (DUF6527)